MLIMLRTGNASKWVDMLAASTRQLLRLCDVDACPLSFPAALVAYHTAQAFRFRFYYIFQRIATAIGNISTTYSVQVIQAWSKLV